MNELFLSGRKVSAYFSVHPFTVWRQIQIELLRLSQKENPDALAGAIGVTSSQLSCLISGYPFLPKHAISATFIRGGAA
jgi:hypothetical protein